MTQPLQADVVIVGSGIAGALAATRLAQAGLRILIIEAGQTRGPQSSGATFPGCRHQGARMRLPSAARGHPSHLGPPGRLVSAGRPRLLQEHLPEGGGGYHLALARHLPAPRAQRLSDTNPVRPRGGLADHVCRPGALLPASRACARGVGGFQPRSGFTAQRPVSAAAHPANLSGPHAGPDPGRHPLRGPGHATGAQFGRT
ncbi:FAD-dependent oxidoreductase [Castellaniella sp.]|uniref:FAD-dependent oxidoreductase n=1 Tax=Castellaniella sp. TaxID=1955812 RepID=UPI003A4C789F